MTTDGKTLRAGIIGAMDCEVSLLLGMMTGKRRRSVAGFDFYTGRISGTSAVVAKAGVGKVNAAACAAAMISAFSPSFIINTGCMGGIADGMKVTDVVSATDAVEYDLDYGALGTPRGTVFLPGGGETSAFACDPGLSDALAAAAEKTGCRVMRGRIASGDRFVSAAGEKKELSERFGACGCEMEGAAIAHVCFCAGVPFGILRTVSDGADSDAGMSFDEFSVKASRISAEAVAGLMSRFGETKD